jgi:nucleoside-diphosphate-sugar epimerase
MFRCARVWLGLGHTGCGAEILVSMGTKPLSAEDLDHILHHAGDAFAALKDARVFVTGGTGFFGHSLLEGLLHANGALGLGVRLTVLTRNVATFRANSPQIAGDAAVTLLEGDIRSFAFPAERHTHVVHAATDSGGQQADRPAYEMAESILDGTRRVLQFAQATGARRLLFTSTGAVYGRYTTLARTPESYKGGPDQLLLQSAYDESKRMAEHLCVAYAHNTVIEPVIARCFAFVGPHLPLDAHFAIGNFIGAAIADKPIHIKGDGTPRRSWLYTADLAVWLWTLLVKGLANGAYNVGSDEEYTIAEAARIVANTLKPGLRVQIDRQPNPGAPPNSYVPDVSRIRDELGLKVLIPLDEAVRRTAAWHMGG